MIEYRSDEGKFTCLFSGRMDTEESTRVGNELFEKVKGQDLPVVFDLKDVDYVSSAFLRICLRVAREMGDDRFSVEHVKPTVKKVFKIAGFDKIMKIE